MVYKYGLNETDGIVGLSTGLGNWKTGPLYIYTLFNSNLISSPVFAFSLGSND